MAPSRSTLPTRNPSPLKSVSTAGDRSSRKLSPGAPRATPSQTEALKLGFKIGTYPTGMLSPAVAGMKSGLAALKAGEASGTITFHEGRALVSAAFR